MVQSNGQRLLEMLTASVLGDPDQALPAKFLLQLLRESNREWRQDQACATSGHLECRSHSPEDRLVRPAWGQSQLAICVWLSGELPELCSSFI